MNRCTVCQSTYGFPVMEQELSRLNRFEEWYEQNVLPRVRTRVLASLIPLVLLIAAATVADPSMGRSVNRSFYAAVAGVIPVLLLSFYVKEGASASELRADYLAEKKKTWEMSEAEFAVKFQDRISRDEYVHSMIEMEAYSLNWAWVGAAAMTLRAAIGEGAALYALATDKTSTLLLTTAAASVALMFYSLSRSYLSTMRARPSTRQTDG